MVVRFPPWKFGPAFSSPVNSTHALWSRVFQSRLFHPCDLVPRFSSPGFSSPVFFMVPRFPVPRFQRRHSNFISYYLGYLREWGSSLNCRHCVFDHERWISRATSLLYHSHTNHHARSVCRLSTCWLFLTAEQWSSILGCRIWSMEQSSDGN